MPFINGRYVPAQGTGETDEEFRVRSARIDSTFGEASRGDSASFDARVASERQANVDTAITSNLDRSPVASLVQADPGVLDDPSLVSRLAPAAAGAVSSAVDAGAAALNAPTPSTTRQIRTPAYGTPPGGGAPSAAVQTPPAPTLQEIMDRAAIRAMEVRAIISSQPPDPAVADRKSLGVGSVHAGLVPEQRDLAVKASNGEYMTAGELTAFREAVNSIDPTSMGDKTFKSKLQDYEEVADKQITEARGAVDAAIEAGKPKTRAEYTKIVNDTLTDEAFPLAADTVRGQYPADNSGIKATAGQKALEDEAKELEAYDRRNIRAGMTPDAASELSNRIKDGSATKREIDKYATWKAEASAPSGYRSKQQDSASQKNAAAGKLDPVNTKDALRLKSEGMSQQQIDAYNAKVEAFSGERPIGTRDLVAGGEERMGRKIADWVALGASLNDAVSDVMADMKLKSIVDGDENTMAYYRNRYELAAQAAVRDDIDKKNAEIKESILKVNSGVKDSFGKQFNAAKGGEKDDLLTNRLKDVGGAKATDEDILKFVQKEAGLMGLRPGASEETIASYESAKDLWTGKSIEDIGPIEREQYAEVFGLLDVLYGRAQDIRNAMVGADLVVAETKKAKEDEEAQRRQAISADTAQKGSVARFIEGVDEKGEATTELVTFEATEKGIENLREFDAADTLGKQTIAKRERARATRNADLVVKYKRDSAILESGQIEISTLVPVTGAQGVGSGKFETITDIITPKFEEDWEDYFKQLESEYIENDVTWTKAQKDFKAAKDRWDETLIKDTLNWTEGVSEGDAEAALQFIHAAGPGEIVDPRGPGTVDLHGKAAAALTPEQRALAEEAAKKITRVGAKEPRQIRIKIKGINEKIAKLVADRDLPEEAGDPGTREELAQLILRAEEAKGGALSADEITKALNKIRGNP